MHTLLKIYHTIMCILVLPLFLLFGFCMATISLFKVPWYVVVVSYRAIIDIWTDP